MTSLSLLIDHLRARFGLSEEGATMVEYGLMVALVAIVAIVAIGPMGDSLAGIFDDANDELTGVVATDG